MINIRCEETNVLNHQEVFCHQFLIYLIACQLDKLQIQVDICLPGKDFKSMEYFLEHIKSDLKLSDYGIGVLNLVYYIYSTKVEKSLRISDHEKELRVIAPGTLSTKDFKILSQISGPIVAVKGDDSLAHALSYGKVPFCSYDGHKLGLRANLLQITKNLFGNSSALYQYIKASQKKKERESFLLAEELTEQARQLSKLIQESYSANSFLKGIVNEHLFSELDHEYVKLKEQLLQQYLNSEISISDLEISLKTVLEDRELINK